MASASGLKDPMPGRDHQAGDKAGNRKHVLNKQANEQAGEKVKDAFKS